MEEKEALAIVLRLLDRRIASDRECDVWHEEMRTAKYVMRELLDTADAGYRDE